MVQGIVKLLSLFESSGKKKKKNSKENCKIAFALLSHPSNNDCLPTFNFAKSEDTVQWF